MRPGDIRLTAPASESRCAAGGMRDGYYGHGNFQYFPFYGALWASDFGYKFFLVNGDGEAGIYSNAVSDAGKYVRCVKD